MLEHKPDFVLFLLFVEIFHTVKLFHINPLPLPSHFNANCLPGCLQSACDVTHEEQSFKAEAAVALLVRSKWKRDGRLISPLRTCLLGVAPAMGWSYSFFFLEFQTHFLPSLEFHNIAVGPSHCWSRGDKFKYPVLEVV